MLNKIFSIKDTVEKLLRTEPDTRNSDRLLMLKVWAEQNPNLRGQQFTFIRFSYGFIEDEYADPESIRRARQKIQEEYPELRGEVYNHRHQIREQVRTGINHGEEIHRY